MQIIRFILVVLFFLGCADIKLDKSIQAEFVGKYDKSDKGLDQLIDIEGLYILEFKDYTLQYNTFFFGDDGTFVNDVICTNKDHKAIEKFWENPYDSSVNEIYQYGIGFYEFFGDTIKAKFTTKPRFGIPTYTQEKLFKIIDRNHIQLITIRGLPDNHTRNTINTFHVGTFYKWKMPYIDSWLKYKKWYWRNPEDWEHFMRSQGKSVSGK